MQIECSRVKNLGITHGRTKYVFHQSVDRTASNHLVSRPDVGTVVRNVYCPDCERRFKIDVKSALDIKKNKERSIPLFILSGIIFIYAFYVSSWLYAFIGFLFFTLNVALFRFEIIKLKDDGVHKIKNIGIGRICRHTGCRKYQCKYIEQAVINGLELDTLYSTALLPKMRKNIKQNPSMIY